jgi:hypothetical protein
MNPTSLPLSTPGRPARTCQQCGEFLPHFCAPEITIIRQKWTGRRIVTINDRHTTAEGGAAA